MYNTHWSMLFDMHHGFCFVAMVSTMLSCLPGQNNVQRLSPLWCSCECSFWRSRPEPIQGCMFVNWTGSHIWNCHGGARVGVVWECGALNALHQDMCMWTFWRGCPVKLPRTREIFFFFLLIPLMECVSHYFPCEELDTVWLNCFSIIRHL